MIVVSGRTEIEPFIQSGKFKERVEITWKYEADSKGMPNETTGKLMEEVQTVLKQAMENDKLDIVSTQQEIERPKPLKEGKVAVGTGDVAVSPGNVVHDVAVNAKNACNSGQSKVKESKAKENKELPPSAPPKGKEEERKEDSASLPIPGYAFNTMTHNYPGLTDTLKRLGINEVSEVNAILRLSDYGRKGTTVWRLIANTCWSDIGAKGRYLIAALNKAKRR